MGNSHRAYLSGCRFPVRDHMFDLFLERAILSVSALVNPCAWVHYSTSNTRTIRTSEQ
jgi:hypothetical protein